MEKAQLKSKMAMAGCTSAKEMNARIQKEKDLFTKRRVKFVAYMQLLIFSIALLAVLLSVFITTFFTVVMTEVDFSKDPQEPVIPESLKKMPKPVLNIIISFAWFGVAIGAVQTVLELWAATSLLKATEAGVTTAQALKCIRFWRNVTIIFTILDVLALGMVAKCYYFAFFIFVARVVFFADVYSFKHIMERKAAAGLGAYREAASATVCLEVVIPKQ